VNFQEDEDNFLKYSRWKLGLLCQISNGYLQSYRSEDSGKIPSVTLSPDASDLQNKHAYFDPPVMDRIWYDTSTRRSDNRASLSRQKLVHESPVGD
jgi:hypothetical protein